MKRDIVLILIFWIAVVGLWAMSVWGGWAERHYEKVGGDSISWFWLRRLGVATTKRNCVRFTKGYSLLGIVLLTVGVALTCLLAE